MKSIILATKNEGKLREARTIFPERRILSMAEAGADPDIVEDGTSFEENARIKAKAVYEALKDRRGDVLVLADDSGIEIDYLGKAPGVHSARYLGEDTPYSHKNQVILERLANAVGEQRSARYICAIAAILDDGIEHTVLGAVEGRIAYRPAGSGGFGYDPIFYVPAYGKTMAELTPEEKNAISHRGKALREMRRWLEDGKYW